MTWFPLVSNDSPEQYDNYRFTSRMACELSIQCDLDFGILKCTLSEDTIDVDLKVQNLMGIHTFIKDKQNTNNQM